MSNVEAASSLFGPSDAVSDPFEEDLGNDETTNHSTSHGGISSSAIDAFYTEKNSLDVSASFDNSSYLVSQDFVAYNAGPAGNEQYDGTQDFAPTFEQSHYAGNQQDYNSEGWYDEYGIWHRHEESQLFVSEAAGSATEASYENQNYTVPLNLHDPYAPSSALTSYVPYGNSTTPSQTQTVYDSYNPPLVPPYDTQAHSSSATPVLSQISSFVYNPYDPIPKPGVPGHSQRDFSSASHSQTPYGSAAATIPKPPPPAPAVIRPKVSNAYDPPIPTSKPVRRGAPAYQPRVTSPPVGQQTYPPIEYHPPGGVSVNEYGSSQDAYRGPPNGLNSAELLHSYPSSERLLQNAVDNRYNHTSDASIINGHSEQGSYGGTSYQSSETSRSQDFSPPPRSGTKSPPSVGSPYATHIEPDRHTSQLRVTEENEAPSAYGSFEQGSRGEFGGEGFLLDDQPFATDGGSVWDVREQSVSGLSLSNSDAGTTTPRTALPDCPPETSPSSRPLLTETNAWDPYRANISSANYSAPFSYGSSDRSKSPGTSSIHSTGSQRGSLVSFVSQSEKRAISPPLPTARPMDPHQPYDHNRTPISQHEPHLSNNSDRSMSPSGISVRSSTNSQGISAVQTPYLPPSASSIQSLPRDRSTSNSSTFSASPSNDLYAPPSRQVRRQLSETSDYGNYTSRYDYSKPPTSVSFVAPSQSSYDYSGGQEVTLIPPTYAPYVPSPSLSGTNDPLGRAAARVPVFHWGFGGKVVTCFHTSPALATGFDVAMTSRHSTDVQIRLLYKVIPESALDMSAASYPGPLFSDPGTPTTSLVRTGASTQTKAKKGRVVKYLDERIDEISQGIGYISANTVDLRHAEGKLALAKVLKIMVENDGRVSGSPQLEAAVSVALVPRLDISSLSPPLETLTSFSSLDRLPNAADGSVTYVGLGFSASDSHETPLATYTLRASSLDKIQNFLLRGERRQAYHYALDEKLWAHAMVIANSLDKDAWKEVVNEFIQAELGVRDQKRPRGPFLSTRSDNSGVNLSNGRESLRVAYSLFSGQGANSVQQLLPPRLFTRAADVLHPPPVTHITPMSPNFPQPGVATSIPVESLSKWNETAAAIYASHMPGEASAALISLGDYLLSNQWIEAAHVCYLLSRQTSLIGGSGAPSVRITLVGSRNPHSSRTFGKDCDPIIFSEILEFALSLGSTPKGQDPFPGLAHLQPYRLLRAVHLAELGHVQLASRYCEAILASTSRASPYFTPHFMDQLKDLKSRLTGDSPLDTRWMGGRMTKPSLDSIGNWLEGRFTKFIAGDGESSPPPSHEDSGASERPAFVGPFSHYSSISSSTTSTSPSPTPSVVNVNVLPGSQQPSRRSGSAMASRPPPVNPYAQIDRAASAMDHLRPSSRKSSPPRTASAGAAITSFAQAPSFGQVLHGVNGLTNGSESYRAESISALGDSGSFANVTGHHGDDQDTGSWWGSYSGDSGATPTATNFTRVEGLPTSPSSEGFISLMDNQPTPGMASGFTVSSSSSRVPVDDDEADELGLGNSKSTLGKTDKGDGKKTDADSKASATTKKADDVSSSVKKPELTSAASGSWLGRWWPRSGSSSPAPIKANLGEESTFYYDKELKQWVNKKAGSESSTATPPPAPPLRSQTASPARSASLRQPPTSPNGPPPRPASAVENGGLPPKKPSMRVRSNLVPDGTESLPSTPASTATAHPSLAPPPPGRPKSQASRKSVRNRYVDVFQQPEGS